ncbi:MAG: hypothetical protein ACI87J_002120 [Colwellia sp.]|jgi:hypothetical protein
MDELTDKQKHARAYYAKNAEKIKAQKREAYNNSTGKKTVIKPKIVKARPSSTKVKSVVKSEERKISVREKIENLKLEQEQNLDWY